MDALQQQITTLNHKVDALYQIIEQLSHKIPESLSDFRQMSVQVGSPSSLSDRCFPSYSSSRINSAMTHKDVLVDSNCIESNSAHNTNSTITPDIQIQRLTAQLTAAYNRIAALEEQLLSQRIHS
ncbi:MAG: hypothetical protein KME06_13825 [Kastovskya adunca ATA6-11-RM4]|jgi:hypothetical protein|nr:hypothetical protein [Kastovskya adunca ATA6-11-RM4]